MLTLRTTWACVKRYWGLVTLVIGFIAGIVVMLFARSKGFGDVDWQKQYDDLQKQHEKELDEIRAEERRREQELIDRYETTMNDIQRQYDESRRRLEDEKRKEIEDIIVRYSNDPNKVAKELSELLPGVTIKLPGEFE